MIRQGPPVPPYEPPPKQEPPPPPYIGPDYQGFIFTLLSGSDKPTHTLTIDAQYKEPTIAKTAYITGTWQGDGEPKAMTGVITDNGGSINCGWNNLSMNPTVHNNLVGTLSYGTGNLGQVRPSAYLKGTVTSYVYGTTTVRPGGPGNVSGEGAPPLSAAL